jgi:GST-like protein
LIDFYTFDTPNGKQVGIMLEESGLDYTRRFVDLRKGENRTPQFEKISPDHTIPAIYDHEGPNGGAIRVFEAGAILPYLGEKVGRYCGNNAVSRLETTQWMMIVLTGLAPASREFFLLQPGDVSSTESVELTADLGRLGSLIHRYVSVLDFRLREFQFLAKSYSIADMAAFPWIAKLEDLSVISIEEFVGVRNWFTRMKRRPAVVRGMQCFEEADNVRSL